MSQKNKLTFELIAGFVFILIVFNSLKVANQFYPYSFSWDMDLLTSIDMLFVQSQRLHVHFAHPATGMYMLLKPIHFLAYQLGFVDTLTLTDLAEAHNPSLAMAQLTDFARSIIPFIITIVGILLSCTLLLIQQNSFFFRFIVLALIFSGYWVIQQAVFIRTETFAWLYLSCACLFAILAAQAVTNKTKNVYLGLIGLFMGLTYFTKIQSLPTLILPLILFLTYNSETTAEQPAHSKKMSTVALGLLIFLVTASLFYGFPPDTYIEHFREQVAPTAHGLLILSVFIYLYVRTAQQRRISKKILFSVPVSVGFISSFFLPLFQYSNISKGIELSLINFQAVTMTKIYSGLRHQVAPTLDKVFTSFQTALPILIPLLIICSFVIMLPKKNAQHLKLKWGLGAIFGLIIFNLIFSVRDASRHDIVWYEPIAYIAILMSLSFLWTHERKLKWASIAIIFVMIILNINHTSLAYNNSQFSYGEERPFLKQAYPGQRDYTSIFTSYTKGLDQEASWQFSSQLLRQARDHKNINYFLRFYFVNINPDIRWVSSAQKGFKILSEGWHITDSSENLRGSHLLDLTQTLAHGSAISKYKNLLTQVFIEPQFAKKLYNPNERVSIRIQNDTTSHLLIDPKQNTDFGCKALPDNSWIKIEKIGEPIVILHSYYCDSIVGIPVSKIKGPILVNMILNNP